MLLAARPNSAGDIDGETSTTGSRHEKMTDAAFRLLERCIKSPDCVSLATVFVARSVRASLDASTPGLIDKFLRFCLLMR